MKDAEIWMDKVIDFIVLYGPKIIGAIIIYIIGSWIIKKLINVANKGMTKQQYDESLKRFLLNLAKWDLQYFLF